MTDPAGTSAVPGNGFAWRRAVFNSSSALTTKIVLQNVLRLASSLILTRLLFPEAFGIILVLVSVTTVLTLLAETGIGAFVMRTDAALTPRYRDTVWTVQVARGVLLAVVLVAVAPLVAAALGKPEVTLPLRVIAVTFVLEGLRSLSFLREQKERRDWFNSVVEMGIHLAQFPLVIALAWWLRSEWALILGMIAVSGMKAASSYLFYREPWHRFRLDRDVLLELWRFSRLIAASSLITIVLMQLDKFLVVGTMSLAAAGLYNQAWQVAVIGATLASTFAFRVYFPEFVHRAKGVTPSPATYYGPMRFVRPIIAFGAAGGITFGEAFFLLLFDPRYAGAGLFLSILSLRSILVLYAKPGEMVMLAFDKPHTKFVSDVLRLIWLPAAAILGLRYYGTLGLLWAVALTDLLPAIYYHRHLAARGLLSLRGEAPTVLAIGAGAAVGWAATLAARALGLIG